MLSPRPRAPPQSRRGAAHGRSAEFVVGTTTVSNRNRYPDFGPWPTSQLSAGAFAPGSLGGVSEFHLSPPSTPAVELLPARGRWCALPRLAARIQAQPPLKTSRLGTFNRSNNLVGSLLWYYRACWHQNLAQVAFARRFTAGSSSRTLFDHLGPRPLDSFRTCC